MPVQIKNTLDVPVMFRKMFVQAARSRARLEIQPQDRHQTAGGHRRSLYRAQEQAVGL
jgi:hypothetical protein